MRYKEIHSEEFYGCSYCGKIMKGESVKSYSVCFGEDEDGDETWTKIACCPDCNGKSHNEIYQADEEDIEEFLNEGGIIE